MCRERLFWQEVLCICQTLQPQCYRSQAEAIDTSAALPYIQLSHWACPGLEWLRDKLKQTMKGASSKPGLSLSSERLQETATERGLVVPHQ